MLCFEGVHAGYGRTTVLHGIDLVVPQGSTVALLGANGAGKTTLLKVAAGLLPASAGTVTLAGRGVGRQATYQRARNGLCLIPEGRGIFRQLTVRENIAMFTGGRNVGSAFATAADAFPVLGQRHSQLAGTLSGGEQQMLAVSRALVNDAPLILADELSVGLAPVIVEEIFAVVATLRKQGRTLLIVEQYVDRVLSVADYVYVLHKGTVGFVGEPGQCHNSQIFEQYLGSVA